MSGGVKFDKDKPRMDLLSSIALFEVAKVMTYGAVKYGDQNWRKGIHWSRVIAAALRHIFKWLGGENNDAETGISHLAHAACCLMFLLEYATTHKELDDRYQEKKEGAPEVKCDSHTVISNYYWGGVSNPNPQNITLPNGFLVTTYHSSSWGPQPEIGDYMGKEESNVAKKL